MSKRTIKIITNGITTSRLILAVILILIMKYLTNCTFIILMACLYLTDFIDGFLARTFKVQTFYGSIMDTLADKVLNIALILPLIKNLPIISIILVLELLIMSVNIWGKIKGKKVRTTYLGKIKMWVMAGLLIISYMMMFNIIKNINITVPIILISILEGVILIDYFSTIIKQKEVNKILSFKNKEEFLYKFFDTDYYLKNS